MPKWMRSGKRYDKKKGSKRPFQKFDESEDENGAVHQVFTVCKIESVTQYLYSVARKTRAQEWILDFGAPTHMTRDEKHLSDCKPMKAVTVTLANGDRLTAALIRCATFSSV